MRLSRLVPLLSLAAGLAGCASSPEVKRQGYARLSDHRTFEQEFPAVWKGIETAFKEHRIVERDPEEVSAQELKSLPERSIETDWIYAQSRDKYYEYQINGSPRKKPLQIRFKQRVTAKRVMGGTEVTVQISEEIERLKEDGSSDGYEKSEPDSSRAREMLEKIKLAILAAPPG